MLTENSLFDSTANGPSIIDSSLAIKVISAPLLTFESRLISILFQAFWVLVPVNCMPLNV